MKKLLLVEDDEGLRTQMEWALADEYQVLMADTLETAVDQFRKENPYIVCLDMGLENKPERGLDIISELIPLNRQVKIIVITSNTSESLGPRAIEFGAFDYLTKPVDIPGLKVLLTRAARMIKLEKPPEDPIDSKGLESTANTHIIGASSAMTTIFSHIKKLSKTDVNVLITGESGTGKELCARAIHYYSNRKNKAFVPINCGAIPESLMESELFGYMKGAFTGAHADKTGLIESANQGTLFLDEIGDMPKALQVKLLRFLEDQQLQRIGETKLRKLDVRILAATNRSNLSDENNEAMRTDLYYRLSEFEIHLPDLKDREGDIILLANHLISKNRHKFEMPKLKLSPRAEKMLMNYGWPGNVRELENKINRATITCVNQVIEVEDLKLSETSFTNLTFKEARQMFEKNYLLNVLKQANGVVSTAAKLAGVTRPTFYDMMKKNEITVQMKANIESS